MEEVKMRLIIRSKCLTILVIIPIICSLLSCELDTAYDLGFDFLNSFGSGKIIPDISDAGTPTGKMALVLTKWEIGGERRDAIITVATSQITFDLPANREGHKLYFGVGARFLIGDGVEGSITVEQEGGGKHVVYKRYLNPIANENERRWFDESIDLYQYNGKAIKITFAAGPGPAGEGSADWFAWSAPVLSFPRR